VLQTPLLLFWTVLPSSVDCSDGLGIWLPLSSGGCFYQVFFNYHHRQF
jgi:hypothetical protein